MWDCSVGKKLRYYPSQYRNGNGSCELNGKHFLRVGTMGWNGCLLTTGSRDHAIYNRDVREAAHFSSSWPCNDDRTTVGHRQEVCGLRWSNNEKILASGGNDNRLLTWQIGYEKPLWDFNEHVAAIKALSWNPHSQNIIASGGGTADRCIKFWDVQM